ncbi:MULTISPECIES: TIM barrel protein [Thermococcus]|uniref:Endonuclease IV n=2 Tax=Thermococcus sibiricus TaxID=172049 RepID=C6A2X5_THESM|nr:MULTISPECIES: deoxyribonuclease IV [Thermococcus]KUK29422.1 MAG: Endonuclease IV [Thermococcus sp. 40_45]HII66662.1 TIM barrel protein [Thermococcaceae archaeon]ACS89970.1 Endonuclease IV [Thermococcus sibiricus MM 739]KUK18567.1 MAG: Endonuclease IV [Thermococcus sibiricus]MBC7095513.1 TIM barrel protein [Thermococcus sp.]
MKKVDRLRFGTAGIPISTPKPSTLTGIEQVKKLGLDAMELEFVRGVNLKPEMAKKIKYVAQKNDILLTAHAPYYINLNATEKAKREASKNRIIQSAERLHEAGGWSVVFHAGYYLKQEPSKVYDTIKSEIRDIVKTLQDKGVNVWIRPELTGKPTQFGSLNELIRISQEVEQVLPAIDFAHCHARNKGKYNSTEEWREMLSLLEEGLGRDALNNMHIHISGIEYSDKGEKNHLNLQESDMKWKDLLRVLKEFKVKGVVISESPNIEGDAILMKRKYEKIKV